MKSLPSLQSADARSTGLTLVERVIALLSRTASAIGGLMIFITMFLIVADVFMRYFFNDPIEGVAEIVSASIVTIVFLQLPNTIRRKRMINADMWFERLQRARPRTSLVVESLYFLVGAIMLLVLVYYILPKVVRAYTAGHTIGTPGIFVWPLWPFEFGVLAGAALATLVYFVMSIRYFLDAIAAERGPAK